MPLSFDEFSSAYDKQYEAWRDYKMFGGLPAIANQALTKTSKQQYLKNIFDETYLIDLIERHNIKNPSIIKDLLAIIASNLGSLTNTINISNTFKSAKKVNVKSLTLDKYISYMKDAFIIHEANRYDIKGKKKIGATKK